MGTVRRVDESVLELVRNLMARAESSTSENEARMCRERADRLIFKHAIDMAQLAGGGESDVKMKKATVMSRGTYRTVIHKGQRQVARAYGTVFTLYGIGVYESALDLYGEQADVDVLELVLVSLEGQALAGMRQWWKRQKAERPDIHYWSQSDCLRARRSWIASFFQGVVAQVNKSRREVVDSAGKGELVVMKQNRGKDFAQHSGVTWNPGRQSRTNTYHVADGYQAGLEASLIAGGVAGGGQVRQVEA